MPDSLRICHVIDTLDPAAGGPPGVVLHMAAAQRRGGLDPSIVTHPSESRQDAVDAFISGIPGASEVPVIPVRDGVLRHALRGTDRPDVIHLHGMWDRILREAMRWACVDGVPYMLRPAGMLEPWSLNHKRLKKSLALRTTHRALTRRASALHATATSEAQNFRAIGLAAPIAVIPNGVNVDAHLIATDDAPIVQRWPALGGRKRVLFLSRLHPKKGLENLARAWGQLCQQFEDWHLVIAGGGDDDHRASIETAFTEAGMSARTTFTGPVDAQLRPHLYAACDLFVLPTFSENFGVVVAEAMASALPVITTVGAPWADLESHNCGWWIDIGADPLTRAMTSAMSLSDEDRHAMGMRGRACVTQRYAWPAIVGQTSELYTWLAGRGDQPGFVHLPGSPISG